MTDQELIKALRCCYDGEGCKGCLCQGDNENCMNANPITAADCLETLLAEIEELKAQVPKWISAEERMPVLTEREIREIQKFGIEGAPEFIVQIIGADRPTVLMFDGEKWIDHDGNWYSVARWMAIPGVEGVGK